MRPATLPPEVRDDVRLLVVNPTGESFDRSVVDLPEILAPGDLVIVNDAATLPASLPARGPGGEPLEIRLLAPRSDDTWQIVLFGAGDWRTRTEDRPPPPRLGVGAQLEVGDVSARIAEVSTLSPRLVDLCFARGGDALWDAIYRLGRPIQYAYTAAALELWSVQTLYAGRPWATELPSAGRPLSARVLLALRRRGIELGVVTHATGLSTTGDPALDAALPLPERYDIPAATVDAIGRARARGGRVIAVGTTVVRALEGAAAAGPLRPGTGTTDLRIDAGTPLRVVDGLLTGMHAPGESHYRLLHAFTSATVLAAAVDHAVAAGYRTHEFGDLCLVGAWYPPTPSSP
jgi:S-adenosylmethionine:tRNA ribosyltransferase-isomerase